MHNVTVQSLDSIILLGLCELRRLKLCDRQRLRDMGPCRRSLCKPLRLSRAALPWICLQDFLETTHTHHLILMFQASLASRRIYHRMHVQPHVDSVGLIQ